MARKKDSIIALCMVTAVLVIIIILSLYNNVSEKTLYSSFIAGETSGFDLNSSALTFGKIMKGNSAARALFINNTNDYKVKVRIKVYGDIFPYLTAENNNFYLEPNERRKVTFSINVPNNIDFGIYEGEIKIILTRF